MAGSRSWKKYKADNGQFYSVNIDESNAEAADFDDLSLADEIAGAVPPPLPRGMKMRSASVLDADVGSSRKIWVGKPDSGIITGSVSSLLLFAFNNASGISEAIAWVIQSIKGETQSSTRPRSRDSGFLDGDNT